MATILTLPAALAHGLVPAGLTAPGLRMALVLMGAASSATGQISMVKPHLERDACVRLDNTHRSLERLRNSTIVDTRGDPALLFDELNYSPGEQKRLAGIVSGRLSDEAQEAIRNSGHAGRSITISIDELGRLSTIPGILLFLRLAADRADGDIRLRMDEGECQRTFGDYLSRATIRRVNADGDEFRWTALSRIYGELVEPGVKDLWSALEGYVVDAVPGVPEKRGAAWTHIDITMKRLQPRKSLRELAAASKYHQHYEIRKREPRRSKAPVTTG